MKSHWYILGAGAMGCQWATALLEGGHSVTLILHSEARLARLSQLGGIVLEADGQTTLWPVEGLLAENCPVIEHLLVTTKAYDAVSAVSNIQHCLTADAQVILLQNGMGSQQAVRTRLVTQPVMAGTTTNGAWLRQPFHVVQAGRGNTEIGLLNPGQHPTQALPNTPMLSVQWHDAIEVSLWRKLAINCAINPLTAVNHCQNGQLVEQPELSKQLQQVCTEITQVLDSKDLDLFPEGLFRAAASVAQQTGQNYSSMLQDIQKGRRSEIDFITGYLLNEAEKLKLSLPLNQSLFSAVKNLER
ncbi:2-dehydropantoate 2-reductase [Neptuniibacter sp. CAU 1671]|uniref:ketopantoate reductase family protein n=1 Tax=Neptuniibacter sp. CAU 1671 TaxID=3032593 RepID=UPI0023DC0719|nr:2-dehydropantoate 2-reductase [Neptuniibacter sp. CAU 1671]MDF2182160.1 2-dehydropantoate 2-reductase [Neptuniibacter sp. CAU 1671]